MKLGKAIAAYQQKHDMDGKNLAREIGINESTLTRIKQGKMPDVANFWKIIAWLLER